MKNTFAMFAVASAVLVAGFVVASEPVVSTPKVAKAPGSALRGSVWHLC